MPWTTDFDAVSYPVNVSPQKERQIAVEIREAIEGGCEVEDDDEGKGDDEGDDDNL